MTSKIDIINRALARIGADKIASLDEESAQAITASDLYPDVREDLLSRHRWSFIKGQQQLARLTVEPSARWSAAYQLPTGIGNVAAVLVNDRPIKFDRQDDKILCNCEVEDQVFLEYTDDADEERWPSWFCTLISYELASAFSIPIGDRADLAEWYEKKALRHFSLCKTLDAQGKTTRRVPVGRFNAARRGGAGVF
jgi:hypothetical protein